jgi:hypothetical protein
MSPNARCMKKKLHILQSLYNNEAYLTWSSKQPLRLSVIYHVAEDNQPPPPYTTPNTEQYKNLTGEDIARLLTTSGETLLELAGTISLNKRPPNVVDMLLETARNLAEVRRISREIDTE